MKNQIYIAIISLGLLVGCSNDGDITNNCNVNNPIEDLPWLKDIKTSFEMSASSGKKKIIQYDYKSESVFFIDACVQCPDAISVVYSCEKELICEFGGIDGRNTCPDFGDEAKNPIVLWEN